MYENPAAIIVEIFNRVKSSVVAPHKKIVLLHLMLWKAGLRADNMNDYYFFSKIIEYKVIKIALYWK